MCLLSLSRVAACRTDLKPRAGHSLTIVGNQLVVMGGRYATNEYANDAWSYDIGQKVWSKICSCAPFSPRAYHSATLVNQREIWVIGGNDADEVKADVHAFDIVTKRVIHDVYPERSMCLSRWQVKSCHS